MSEKKSFVVMESVSAILVNLPEEKAGELIKAMACKQLGIEYAISDSVIAGIFASIEPRMDEADLHYAETCLKRAKSGSKGGKQKVANASKRKQMLAKASNSIAKASNSIAKASKTKQTVADNDSDIDNDNDTTPLNNIATVKDKDICYSNCQEKDISVNSDLNDLFNSKELAKVFDNWIACRTDPRMTPYPPAAMADDLAKATDYEKEYGAKAVIDVIESSYSYKRIAWDKLTKKPSGINTARANGEDDYFMRLAKGEEE